MELNIDFFRVKHKLIAPQAGHVLIAEPGLGDQYFKRAVVLLTEHNDKGTLGFLLNREVDLKLEDLIPDFPDFDCSISIGGPVSPNSIHFIHTLGDIVPDTVRISDGLYWGGNFNTIQDLIEKRKITPLQIRFFVGYSGWSTGQLEDEIKEESWVVAPLDTLKIMLGKEHLWSDVVEQLGERYKPWTIYPDNPSLN